MDSRECLKRYPRICAHLICASLGYFTPRSAASAVLAAKEGKAYWCEWYASMGGTNEEGVKKAGEWALRNAIQRRHYHKGCMADYRHALALVNAEFSKCGATSSMLASWF